MNFAIDLSSQPSTIDHKSEIWEARSIPGNIVGIGSSPIEALLSVRRILEWTRDEEDFERWYFEAWEEADSEDITNFRSADILIRV